jgi:alpha-L-fucosidase 2
MERHHEFYLTKPAKTWDEGLPLGNGRLGAMILGKVNEETIFINEETIWYGKDRDRKNPDTLKHLSKIRSLLFEGKVEEAQFLAKMAMTSTPKYMNPYQPAGDMRLCFKGIHGKPENYERRLDLDHALAEVSFQLNGFSYQREHFVSHQYQVFATRLTTDCPEGMTLSVNMSRKPFEENTGAVSQDTVSNYGVCGPEGISWFTGITMTADVPTATIGDFVYVKNAREIVIYLACATDFVEKDYQKRVLERLETAKKAGYETIRTAHIREYQELYGRMELSINESLSPELPMNELLDSVKRGEEQYVPYLAEQLFAYARYLMIGSSYDCVLPSNLQGIWNGDFVPPWQSEFTININTEMNYWMAEKCGLSECHLPLFAQVKRMIPKGQKTAKELYGCRGFVAHHNTNIWANTDPEGIFDASPVWATGAAWLSLHFYEHYRYTLDQEFLRKEALPVMREVIRFYEDYLTENPEGYLVTGPSLSPENTYRSQTGEIGALCMGPAMDMEILRQLFREYLEGCEILKLSEEESDEKKIRKILEKLPPIRLTSDGRIREWQEEYEEMEPGHRHISHLYALHPGYEITEEKEELFQAAKKTLEARLSHGGGHTGWSRAWITCFSARLKDGKAVGENIQKMLAVCIKDNLLDIHPPFQIDGNFGVGEAILESLAQSHSGYLEFLPALPPAWKTGSVRGMILRAGIQADFSWKDGCLTKLNLTAKDDREVCIRYNGTEKRIALSKGQKTELI